MDWTFIGTVIGLVGSIIVAILQNRGKTAAAEQATKALSIVSSVIQGVEKSTKADPKLSTVKEFIKSAAMDAGVQDELHALVKKLT